MSREGSSKMRVVLVACPGPEAAAELARELVERRLAACVSILPNVRSIYRWKGKIEDEPEALALIKTAPEALVALERAVEELHPYEVPEFVVLSPASASAAYLEWMAENVRP